MTDAEKILHALAEIQKDIKALQEGQKSLHEGQQALRTDVTTLQDGQKSLQTDVKSLQEGQKSLEQGQMTTDLKVEAFHVEQNEANKEIITTIHDVITIDAKVVADRFERIEKHLNLPPLK
jgi:chromosome segregation ATPase